MTTKISVFWLMSLFLLLFIYRTVFASTSDSESSQGDEDGLDVVEDNQDDFGPHGQGNEVDEEGEEGEEDDFGVNPEDVVEPEAVYLNIIYNGSVDLPINILPQWPINYVQTVLKTAQGARLIATRSDELFTMDLGFLTVDDIHQDFFHNVDLFGATSLENVPAFMVARFVKEHSDSRKLNLNDFIAKFAEVSFSVDPVYQLPHLFDVPNSNNPLYYLGRGMAFNPGINWADHDYVVWSISLQILIQKLVLYDTYRTIPEFEKLKQVILQKLEAAKSSRFGGVKINYFDLKENDQFPPTQVFDGLFVTLEGAGTSIDSLFASAGLSNYTEVKYNELTSDKKIIYRLLTYVAIANPSVMREKERSKMIVDLVKAAHANDFSAAEIEYFTKQCLLFRLADTAASIFRTSPNSRFTQFFQKDVANNAAHFDAIVEASSGVAETIPFVRRWPRELTAGIRIANEEDFKTARPANNPEFDSHFLTEENLKPLVRPYNPNNSSNKFIVPCPNKDFFNARFDHWMQNLDSGDFGEVSWKKRLDKLTPEEREESKQNEEALDLFVQKTFMAAHFMQMNPKSSVEIVFDDSPSFGNGPKIEALEMLTRALLLPRYKVLFYNPKIIGFVPYPLLDPKIMAVLGYLNGWFIKQDIPINWSFSSDFVEFLFYEENTEQAMQQVIEHFYSPLFKIIEELYDRNINPLDYFPTAISTHRPLALTDNGSFKLIDLFAPSDSANSEYLLLASFLNQEALYFLDEIVHVPHSKMGEESKEEPMELAESKMDEPVDDSEYNEAVSRLKSQMQMKLNIIDTMKLLASSEIIGHLLACRFAFIREYFRFFNTRAIPHINATFYKELQDSFSQVIRVEDLVDGFHFPLEHLEVKVIGAHEQEILTPRQTLTRVLESLVAKLLKTFYWFCTGCTSLPLGGLDKNPIKVDISRKILLPSAATCYRTLKFNIQPTLAANIGAMRIALQETSGYQFIENRDQVSARATAATNILNALTNAANGPGFNVDADITDMIMEVANEQHTLIDLTSSTEEEEEDGDEDDEIMR